MITMAARIAVLALMIGLGLGVLNETNTYQMRFFALIALLLLFSSTISYYFVELLTIAAQRHKKELEEVNAAVTELEKHIRERSKHGELVR